MNSLIAHLQAYPAIWIAVVLPALIALIGVGLKWLTIDGGIAAFVVGAATFGFGAGEAAVPLVIFFVVCSALSKLPTKQVAAKPSGARNAYQVLANGGVPAALVVAHFVLGKHITLEANRVVQVMYLASLASMTSDTFATEIGGFFGRTPRLLSSWRAVPPGSSGAISGPGTFAAVIGALMLPTCLYTLWGLTTAEYFAVAWSALLACMFDSILGAGVQGQYRDPVTNVLSDNRVVDGRQGALVRGLAWVDNNLVNVMATIAGSAFCWVLLHYGLRNAF